MRISLKKYNDVVVLRFDGNLGVDENDLETMRDIDTTIEQQLERGSTQFVVNLTRARAVYGASLGLLVRSLTLWRSRDAHIAIVGSKLRGDHFLPFVPIRGRSRLTSEDFAMTKLNLVFDIFPTVEEAIQSLRPDPPDTTDQV